MSKSTAALILFAALTFPWSVLADDLTIRFVDDVPIADANKVVGEFKKVCPDLLGRFINDIESITVEYSAFKPEDCKLSFRCEDYGWLRELYFAVKIRAEPQSIPVAFRAWNHTLHYYLGGGHRPGIFILSDQSGMVCDTRLSKQDAHFIDNKNLSVIDSISVTR